MCCIQVTGPEENVLRGLDNLTSTETGKYALHLLDFNRNKHQPKHFFLKYT